MNTLFILVLIGLPVLGFTAGFYVVRLVQRDRLAAARRLLLALLPLGLLAALVTVYTFGGAFGLGIVIYCLSIPSGLLALLPFASHRRLRQEFRKDETPPPYTRQQRRLLLLGAVAVPLAAFSPLIGIHGLAPACDAWNRYTAAPIIEAVTAYQQANGQYPGSLSDLVPTYLPDVPAPHCFEPYRWFNSSLQPASYRLESCRQSGETLLVVDVVTTGWFQRYNFASGNWSRVSFLDGVCSFLR